MRTIHIHRLPENLQEQIRNELSKVVDAEDLERGMDSRLCDLEDTIEIPDVWYDWD